MYRSINSQRTKRASFSFPDDSDQIMCNKSFYLQATPAINSYHDGWTCILCTDIHVISKSDWCNRLNPDSWSPQPWGGWGQLLNWKQCQSKCDSLVFYEWEAPLLCLSAWVATNLFIPPVILPRPLALQYYLSLLIMFVSLPYGDILQRKIYPNILFCCFFYYAISLCLSFINTSQ